jgi:arylsulfatase A-like enzyme
MKTILLLSGLLLASVAPAPASAASRPNIVFVLMDDLGWADLGCCGSRLYRTPHLDALAASGVRFTQAYAACAVCSPTRAALLTGKAPARLHITDWIAGEGAPKNSRFRLPDWQQHLPLGETTLAEALKELGYATAHVGKWHLGGTNCLPQFQGFDTNIGGSNIGHPASYFWPYGAAGASHRVPGLAERGGKEGEYLTDHLTDEALRFITANRAGPFYLQLWHYAVHSPLMGKAEMVERYAREPGANGQSNAVYAAMVQSMDESVGRILGRLEELRLTDNTIVVFTSDNGGAVHFGQPPATSNAPLRSGKGNPYEGGIRVPLLVRAPGVTRPGRVCDQPVISHDLFPTLLDLAGAPRSAAATATDGASFVPLLRGQTVALRDALFWHYPHYWNGGKVSPYSVVRRGDWKLIRFYESDREELYDLHDDPSETRDLAAAEPARRQALAARLDTWLDEVGAQMPVPR